MPDTVSERSKAGAIRISPVIWIVGWLVFLAMLTLLLTAWLDKRENPNAALADSSAQSLVVTRNAMNHYVLPGKINGVDVTFMIDTGASSVAIPDKVARHLGLGRGVEGMANTANGVTTTRLSTADSISIGGIRLERIPVSVLPNATGDEVLLGMSFLKHLDWQQTSKQLILSVPGSRDK